VYIAVDTETTGLFVRHGCRPFFVSTWAEGGRERAIGPAWSKELPGISKNWSWRINPLTRLPSPRNPHKALASLAAYLEGHSLVFFNAPFDLLALASMGFYVNFKDVGGFPWSSETLYYDARPELRRTLTAPLYTIDCDELHDAAILSHARDNKRPSPPAGLKDCAVYYLMIPVDDEEALRQATIAERHAANKQGWPLGVDPDGSPSVEADYYLSFQKNPEVLSKYASLDAYRTLALFFFLKLMTAGNIEPASPQDNGWQSYRRQMAVLPPSMLMGSQGVRLRTDQIDPNNSKSLVSQLTGLYLSGKKRAEDYAAAHFDTPKKFNVQSGKQLAPILYTKAGCNLPLLTKTKKGANLPTDNVTLQKLYLYCVAVKNNNHDQATTHLIPEDGNNNDLLGRDYTPGSPNHNFLFRRIETVLSFLDSITTYEEKSGFPKDNVGYKAYGTGVTYANGYIASATSVAHRYTMRKWRTPLTERWPGKDLYLFPTFNPVGITLTRFSSRNPNGQNVSKKPHIPLRKLFQPAPGRVWVCIDYSQLELRLFAAASGDESLTDAFRKGYDFHTFTACGMYGYNIEHPSEIPSHLRRVAKNVNFGIVYGAGPAKIALTSGDSEAYEKYSKQFPKARQYMDAVIRGVERTGSVHTLYGYELRVYPEPAYKGVNYVVQGTAGELVKRAMTALYFDPDTPLDWDRCRLVLNVHDELVFDLEDDADYLNQTVPVLMRKMTAAGLPYCTPVDAKLCRVSWGEEEDHKWPTITAETEPVANRSNRSTRSSNRKRFAQKSTRSYTSA
jgi:DNA polymerase family A